MKSIKKILIIIVALAILLFSLNYSLKSYTYDFNYYKEYSIDNDIKDTAGVDQVTLEKMYESLHMQIKSGDTALLTPYFNDREIKHMEDVHSLFALADLLGNISLAIIIFFLIYLIFFSKDNFYPTITCLKKSLLIMMGLLFILIVFISLDFDQSFIKFHELFFDNDLWLLNPETDIMIRMLPQDFFMNIALKIAVKFVSIIVGVILVTHCLGMVKKKRS